MKNNAARDLIDRLASEELSFRGKQFLAPATSGGEVKVRIGKVVCRMKIAPEDFRGFGVFEPISFNEAVLVRAATLRERKNYLEWLPSVSMIATRQIGNLWFGSLASRGDGRFRLDGMALIQMAENVGLFDVVDCRFDGNGFWFDRISPRTSRRYASELRKCLIDGRRPMDVKLAGLTAEHRDVYKFNYMLKVESKRRRERDRTDEVQDQTNSDMNRIRESLSHAGAQLVGLREQYGNFQVSFTVAGRNFTSAVDKESLNLLSAGVCLDGHDQEFDLTSLVGVLHEGIDTRQV